MRKIDYSKVTGKVQLFYLYLPKGKKSKMHVAKQRMEAFKFILFCIQPYLRVRKYWTTEISILMKLLISPNNMQNVEMSNELSLSMHESLDLIKH